MKQIIDDAIAVIPWMKQKILKFVARRHKQKISNNHLVDKEEAETYTSEHQTSVLGLIPTTTVNGGRRRGSILKNKRASNREWMKRRSI